MKRMIFLIFAVMGGCIAQPTGYFYKGTLRADDTSLIGQFETDKAVCNGQAASAALASNEHVMAVHVANVQLVYEGCMAGKGYVVRP